MLLLWRWLRLFTGLALLHLLGALLLLLLHLVALALGRFALLALLVTLEPLRLLCRTTLWRGRRLHSRRRDGHVFLRLLAQGALSRRCFGWLALGVLLPG